MWTPGVCRASVLLIPFYGLGQVKVHYASRKCDVTMQKSCTVAALVSKCWELLALDTDSVDPVSAADVASRLRLRQYIEFSKKAMAPFDNPGATLEAAALRNSQVCCRVLPHGVASVASDAVACRIYFLKLKQQMRSGNLTTRLRFA